jgi:hypothetical protein
LSCQAASAAVSAVHADVGATDTTLTARMRATAGKLTAAGTGYTEQDASNAATIAAVGSAVQA